MNKELKKLFEPVLGNTLLYSVIILARGGGGGSGGGGGGGGGGGHSSSHTSYSSSGSGGTFHPEGLLFMLIPISLFILLFLLARKNQKRIKEQAKTNEVIILKNNNLEPTELKTEIKELFLKFQKAWSEFDLRTMEQLVTPEYYKRMVLELNVLQNEHRANLMEKVEVLEIIITGEELPGETTQKLTVQISASANDTLIDKENNQSLFSDSNSFTEYWHLVQDENIGSPVLDPRLARPASGTDSLNVANKKWRLDFITQETEDSSLYEEGIVTFAKQNNFYYDADFGWLMMPNQGVLFSKTDFGQSDINNHVIGYYREKIVEFYTYIPDPNSRMPTNYLVAQAILPINYKNILIKKKKVITIPVWGLKKMQLESTDFNNKFNLWADPADQINSLELLTPNFMEKIYNLPFELNIEIVGNTLYFYTKDRGAENYPQMLEVLSWAFDEMKM